MDKTLKDLINNLVKDQIPKQVFSVKVQSVDKTKNTCSVLPEDGRPELYGVRLMAVVDSVDNKLVIYPKVESIALVCLIENEKTEAYLLAVSEVESFHLKVQNEISFNEGALGGLPVSNKVKERLNLIENKVNALIDYVNTHVHSGNGIAPSPSFTDGSLSNTSEADIHNEKIKQ